MTRTTTTGRRGDSAAAVTAAMRRLGDTLQDTAITTAKLADDSPAHMWPEAHNPANQWLANHKGRKAAALEVVAAGECARAYVWAAMHPDATRQKVLQEARRAHAAGRRDVAHALREGYDRHRPPLEPWLVDLLERANAREAGEAWAQ